jgi:heme/copper-type cytochrome/quinol oxidase subunit 2
MDLSFREKSLWLMLVALVASFGFYFATVLPPSAADVLPHQVILFVIAVVMLVIMQIVGHIFIAIVDRRAETDERDRLIELKGTRNASYVLASGVFVALCAAMVTDGNFVFTHLLLASWVLAQVVEIGSQLFLHQRGA